MNSSWRLHNDPSKSCSDISLKTKQNKNKQSEPHGEKKKKYETTKDDQYNNCLESLEMSQNSHLGTNYLWLYSKIKDTVKTSPMQQIKPYPAVLFAQLFWLCDLQRNMRCLDVCFISATLLLLPLTKHCANPCNIMARQMHNNGISTTANYVLILFSFNKHYLHPAAAAAAVPGGSWLSLTVNPITVRSILSRCSFPLRSLCGTHSTIIGWWLINGIQ